MSVTGHLHVVCFFKCHCRLHFYNSRSHFYNFCSHFCHSRPHFCHSRVGGNLVLSFFVDEDVVERLS